jgi:predicted Zn-dependent protease
VFSKASRDRMIAFTAAILLLIQPSLAHAGLIRDAEIEHTLRFYANPIFTAANITPEDVHIFIIADPSINAYVAGGLNIFIHTGLIRAANKPGMLIGVIAHETGHISGAHLSQFQEKSTRATIGNVLGAVLGAAVVAGGGGQAGIGVIMGSQNMAQRRLLSDIRMNEQSADHAALGFLDATDISATGMLEMFELLHRNELSGGRSTNDQYNSTHPLTTERIATLRNHIAQSSIPPNQVPAGAPQMHARMQAKLMAFTETYETTLTHYPLSDMSVAARYARAIAEFKRSNLAPALAGINALIRQYPSDPFFYDTKGQILFENGKLSDAAKAYSEASRLAPGSALILTEYAKTLIAQNDATQRTRALALLERAKNIDDSYPVTWRQLAIAYGKQGKLGLSYTALAEEAALTGDYQSVLQHVARARQESKGDPSQLLVLDDLERDAKTQIAEKKKENGM